MRVNCVASKSIAKHCLHLHNGKLEPFDWMYDAILAVRSIVGDREYESGWIEWTDFPEWWV